MRRHVSWILGGAFLVIAFVVGLAWRNSRMSHVSPAPAAVLPPTPLVEAGAEHNFVGSEACASCHAEITEEHAGSLHANSLHDVKGGRFNAPFKTAQVLADPTLGVLYSYGVENGKPVLYHYRDGDGAKIKVEPKYVVGSGQLGYTFLIEQDGQFLESRTSYYRAPNKWTWTPGQQRSAPGQNPVGDLMDPERAKQCFLCHSTMVAMQGDRVVPEKSIFQVGCERCHGPGREHVDARRAGLPDKSLFSHRQAAADTVVRLCGECHRSPRSEDEADLARDPDLPRFAASALTLSKCYQNSAGRLSCVTCHNPHQRVSKNTSSYIRVCQSCHTGSSAANPTCPIDPTGNCVSCHMPSRAVNLPSTVKFHSHWIK